MIDLYKIGFIVVSLVLVTVVGLLVSIASFNQEISAVDYISALGSLVGGVAGLSAAVAAFVGVDAWKKQIMYGRYLSAIWDAKVNLRMVQRALTDCSLMQGVMVNNPHIKSDEMKAELAVNKEKLKELQDSFEASCGVLDKIVTKNDWEYQNYASELSAHITMLLRELEHDGAEVVDIQKFWEARTKDNQTIRDLVGHLDERFDELEAKYS